MKVAYLLCMTISNTYLCIPEEIEKCIDDVKLYEQQGYEASCKINASYPFILPKPNKK